MSVFHFRKSDWAYRSRAEYVSQIISDIASNYGYNGFLAEKLFHLFTTNEVGSGARDFLVRIYSPSPRQSSSSKQTKCHDL
jgi:hypothetical protein